MKYIINNTGIVFFHASKPIKIEKSSPQYLRVLKAFDLPKSEQESAVLEILQQASGFFESDGFKITPEEVFYNGETMPRALADKIRSIVEEGLPISLFAKFWDNLQQNPSANSVRELYDFLAYKELPITEDGCFLAYKGLSKTGWSISGNKETKILKGKVDASGRIHNAVGEEIEVRRWDVDDNRQNHCSYGLHVGSLDYAEDFSQGMVVVVKINPKDVVSVPEDYNCQKCRVSAYKVISIFSEEIESSVCDEDGNEMYSEEYVEYTEFENLLNNFIDQKIGEGYEDYFIRNIQVLLTPGNTHSREKVIDSLNSLGYLWGKNNYGEEIVFLA
jgi:hypothetical protein